MFESPLVPRTAPVVAEDMPWEHFRELDPIGAAQQQAQFWAIDRGLTSAPDGGDDHGHGDGGGGIGSRWPPRRWPRPSPT